MKKAGMKVIPAIDAEIVDGGENQDDIFKEFAHVERNHLAPYLFQIAKRGPHKQEGIHITKELPRGGSLEISGVQPLRPFDAVLLCLVVCKCAQNQVILGPDPVTENGKKLRAALRLKGNCEKADGLVHTTSANKLIKDMGRVWSGGITLHMLEESLWRMFQISFKLERIDKKGTRTVDMFNILNSGRVVEKSGRTLSKGRSALLQIGINPILAKVLMGGGNWCHIDMTSLLSLDKGAEQLLYISLCNTIDPQNKPSDYQKLTKEDLRGMLYGPPDHDNNRKYNRQVRSAENYLQRITGKLSGWKAREHDGKWQITRPPEPGLPADKRRKTRKKKDKE